MCRVNANYTVVIMAATDFSTFARQMRCEKQFASSLYCWIADDRTWSTDGSADAESVGV